MIEDVGNSLIASEIELDGQVQKITFDIFNNAYGQVCDICCNARKCRLDNNLNLIEGNMPLHWIQPAVSLLLSLLEKRATEINPS